MLRTLFYVIGTTLLLTLVHCVPPAPEAVESVSIDYSNPLHKAVRDLEDVRNIRELRNHFQDEDLNTRYLAAAAFSSIPTDEALIGLNNLLLNDESTEVRRAAAYAMGQSQEPSAEAMLIKAFGLQDSINKNSIVRGAILEAVGKVGTAATLDLVASAANYGYSDNHLLLGQALAIYRYGLRGITSEIGTAKMVNNIIDVRVPNDTRVIAANYLHRNRDVDISGSMFQLFNVLTSEPDPQVRMGLVQPLLRSGDTDIMNNVLSHLSNESDYRVKCNLIRGLSANDFSSYRDSILTVVEDENVHVAYTAADLIMAQAGKDDVQPLLRLAREDVPPYVNSRLLGGALNAVAYYYVNSRNIIKREIIENFDKAGSRYEQSFYFTALSQDPLNYTEIIDLGVKSEDDVIKTAAIHSLPRVLTGPKFNLIFRTNGAKTTVRQAIVDALMEVMGSGNSGAIAAASSVLQNEDLGLKELLVVKAPIREALRNLTLPRDLETKIELEKLMAYLDDSEYQYEPPATTHFIDWSQLDNLTDSSKAYIITTKGQIEVQLNISHAPGSVSNFVKLSNDNYYDGKTFHRVVPNFVIQGGCPRGDGYGSLDYTIRSELGPEYYHSEGYIGMASAGIDTEGVQWFITHSPTPHLDGRYTIFGKVVNGMEVVHDIQVGDVIQDVRITRS